MPRYFGYKHTDATKLKQSLSHLGKKNPNYKHGKYSGKHCCTKCNKELCNSNSATLCKSCCRKGLKCSKEHRKNISLSKMDDKNPAKQQWVRGKIRCTLKRKWADPDLRKATFTKLNIYPKQINKVESTLQVFLNYLFPNRYEFVGNGKFIINHYNPDFIDKENGRIIELFGDYWHNRTGMKEYDKKRLKTIRQEGYKVLVIWEHELKDLNKLMYKLYSWHKVYDYNFFQNVHCVHFPCHTDIEIKDFSCMMCFCPLHYNMDCGGTFSLTLKGGVKDCSKCTLTHTADGYEYVIKKLKARSEK